MINVTQRLSKLTRSALRFSRFEQLLKCPICQAQMQVIAEKSLVCQRNHTFDFARQGYIHLMTRSIPSQYDKELFVSRRNVITNSELFTPLTNEIAMIIDKQLNVNTDLTMIDMGTGEGSHLYNISKLLREKYGQKTIGFGLDISKAGIIEAAKHYDSLSWLVADIANSPFTDKSFQVILNILSPANYQEFTRLLGDDGLIIKVIPGKDYLQELRQFFYQNRKQQDYSNKGVVSGFNVNFQVIKHQTLTYQIQLNQSLLKSLLKMTPLTWHASNDKINQFLDSRVTEITVHVEILVGKKKE